MKQLLSALLLAWGMTASAQLSTPQIDLPDPLLMNDGKTRVTELKDWSLRRQEISEMIQTYGIGQKPEVAPEAVKARMVGDTLIVDVTVNGQTLTLSSAITALLAKSVPLPQACREAKAYVRRAMAAGLEIGHGCGPLHHFVDWY